jgi:hypothetical protein
VLPIPVGNVAYPFSLVRHGMTRWRWFHRTEPSLGFNPSQRERMAKDEGWPKAKAGVVESPRSVRLRKDAWRKTNICPQQVHRSTDRERQGIQHHLFRDTRGAPFLSSTRCPPLSTTNSHFLHTGPRQRLTQDKGWPKLAQKPVCDWMSRFYFEFRYRMHMPSSGSHFVEWM